MGPLKYYIEEAFEEHKEMNEMKDTDKEIQKAVAKLIAEEWIAGTMYRMMTFACKKDERAVIKDLFDEIGMDEINDHFNSLVKWCD